MAGRTQIRDIDTQHAQHFLGRRPEIENVTGGLYLAGAFVNGDLEADAVEGQAGSHAARTGADDRGTPSEVIHQCVPCDAWVAVTEPW